LSTWSNLIGILQHARLFETKWRAQKHFDTEVGKLHDFSIRPQTMLFFCFSVKGVLVSSHLAPLTGPLYSLFRRHMLCLPVCVLIDHDSANVLPLDMLLIDGWTLPCSGGVIKRRRMDKTHLTKTTPSLQRKAECTTQPGFDGFAVL
jgi:hypothetical protein